MDQQPPKDNAHWREADSKEFIDYGNYFVPDRETQIEIICDLIPNVSEEGQIVELACGPGLLANALLNRFGNYTIRGLDGSPTMLEHAKALMSDFGDRFKPELFELESLSWRKFHRPAQVIVSSLAIHHLDDAGKQRLYKDMLPNLAPGGALIIADLIRPTTELANKVAAKAWDQAVRQRSLEISGNLDPFEFFLEDHWNLFVYPDPDVDKPSALYDQLRWLDEAGFVDVDVYWMKAGHAIFGGRKPRT